MTRPSFVSRMLPNRKGMVTSSRNDALTEDILQTQKVNCQKDLSIYFCLFVIISCVELNDLFILYVAIILRSFVHYLFFKSAEFCAVSLLGP